MTMSREPNYQQALYDILRAIEILVHSLTSKELLGGDVPEHSHVVTTEPPRARILEHLRSAVSFAELQGFVFDYVNEAERGMGTNE